MSDLELQRRRVAEAYEKYGHLVERRCQRILRDPMSADDAVQDVFVRLWKYGAAYAEADSKLGWLYKVADRCCFDVLGKSRPPGESLELNEVADVLEAPGDLVESAEARELALRFLDRVDDALKQVLVFRYVDGMTQEEIAEAVGWSRQTVNKKLALLHARAEKWRARLQAEEGS